MSILALLLAASAQAQPAPGLSAELQPLAFVVGSCWRGTFPDGRRTDTHCFTPMLGGAFVRDLHVVEGAPAPYSGETIYRWDPDGRRIAYDYYASDGSHSAGTASPAANGLVFPEEAHRAPDGAEQLIRSSWTRDGADAYVVLAETLRGEAWQPLWRMRMVRVGPSRLVNSNSVPRRTPGSSGSPHARRTNNFNSASGSSSA